MSPTKVIQTYQNDTAPDLTFTITREDGSIVDLTGATVTFIIENPVTHMYTNSPNNDKVDTCVITNPTGGVCVYSWNSGGTDTPNVGLYPANIKIEYADDTVETYSMTISVEETL